MNPAALVQATAALAGRVTAAGLGQRPVGAQPARDGPVAAVLGIGAGVLAPSDARSTGGASVGYRPGSAHRNPEDMLGYSAKAGSRLVTRSAFGAGVPPIPTVDQQAAEAANRETLRRGRPAKPLKSGDFMRKDVSAHAQQSVAQYGAPARKG